MIGQPLSITDLHKTYAGNDRPVFDGFSLEVEAGSLCAIVGVSGVGKTTLLNCVAGLDHWEGGHISVGGDPVPTGAEARALYRRRHVGLACQQPHLHHRFLTMSIPTIWNPLSRPFASQLLRCPPIRTNSGSSPPMASSTGSAANQYRD